MVVDPDLLAIFPETVVTLDEENVDFRTPIGYSAIDELVDFRGGNTYLISGYEKSGKSSFVLGAVNFWIKNNNVAYFNTELTDGEFMVGLSANASNKSKAEIEKDKKVFEFFNKIYYGRLFHYGVQSLIKDGGFDFDQTLLLASEALSMGAKIFVFDNLTTYALNSSDKQGWEILSDCVSKLISFTKENKIISFIVIHTKPQTVFNETPEGVRKLIEANDPEKVFEKSISYIRRPSGSDVYGGGGIRSQLSGTILVWRPFQMFERSEHLQMMTQIILENFRHSKGGSVRYTFEGEKGRFVEDLIPLVVNQK